MAPNQPARAYSQKDLPPSVETAYYRKCIDLRRRINDIEESNDSTRLRISRLSRGVTKMRLERAFLLEQLNKHMECNLDDSDRSSSPPPTPTDKPLRSKRSHRKGTPPAGDSAQGGAASVGGGVAHQSPTSVHHSILHPVHPLSSAQSTPDPGHVSSSYFSTIGANAGPGSPPGANGAPTLPPLSSLQQNLGQPPRSEGASRPYFDPAYDEQRSAENDASDEGRRRAYSGAQTAAPPPATSETAPPQNGDTEMTDANFPPANR